MSTLDRLKTLYKERYMEHHDIDRWNEAIEKEWPKLLAVVEAARSVLLEARDSSGTLWCAVERRKVEALKASLDEL